MTANAVTEEMNPSSLPRVVIVIPCYDQAQFLPEAVESACAQTYEQLEIVIVDDGSPDDTAEVASRLAAAHGERRIRLVRQQNQGLPASRNRGIEASAAEFVLSLDADDRITAPFVELCVSALDQHPDRSIAYGGQQNFGDETGFYPHEPYDFVRLTHINQIGVASMFRRRAWEDVGGYHAAAHGYEDWDFWVGCAERGHFGLHVPLAVFDYRVRSGSMFGQVDDQRSKAQVVLRHPVLYSPEQTAWARGVVDDDPGALAIDGPRYQIPILGIVRVAPVRSAGAIKGARRLATAALAGELIAQPQLLGAYCAAITGRDDATLVVVGSPAQFDRLGALLRELGHDGDDAADILALPAEDPEAGLLHAAGMVDALFTERTVGLPVPLPRVDASGVRRLAGPPRPTVGTAR